MNGQAERPDRPRRRRYRCNTEHQDYCSSLLSSYAVPPAVEAAHDDAVGHPHATPDSDESQLTRHGTLLLLLVTSMFVGKFVMLKVARVL